MSAGRLRLLHLRDENEAVSDAMNAERARFQAIKGAEPTRAVQAFNLFQTPEPVAAMMAERLAELIPQDAPILEPSAGLGRLYRAARAAGLAGPVLMIEQAPQCAAELYRSTEGDAGATLWQRDFLSVDATPEPVAGVLMNPPFKQGRDIAHTRHAFELMAPGGVLVGLCYDGVRQREKLRPLIDRWEPLPAGSFKSEGTGAGVALVIWHK